MKKKYKMFLIIFVLILLIIAANVIYFFYSERQNSIINANAAANFIPRTYKAYDNQKLGFQLKYPSVWTIKETENSVEINSPAAHNVLYFNISQRSDIKSLDELKLRLDPRLPTTPIQIDTASGFKYSDDDGYTNNWINHNDKIYIIRTYFSPSQGDDGADQMLATFKFTD